MLKIAFIITVSLAVLGVISLAVDYYFYSWTAFIKPFGCEYKSIGTVFTIGISDDRDRNLEQQYDLIQIGDAIKSNPNYRLVAPRGQEPYNKGSLSVSRMFGDVKYNIRIDKGRTSLGEFTKIGFSNPYSEVYNKDLPFGGEKSTIPNYYIKNNINQMIDEMPLNDDQKKELKEKVQISCSPTSRFSL